MSKISVIEAVNKQTNCLCNRLNSLTISVNIRISITIFSMLSVGYLTCSGQICWKRSMRATSCESFFCDTFYDVVSITDRKTVSSGGMTDEY
jgi:hypothetical protein